MGRRGPSKPNKPESQQAASSGVAQVKVICEGVLGHRRLTKGAITSDPEYVALLGDPRNLVQAVEDFALIEVNTPGKPLTLNQPIKGGMMGEEDKIERETETTTSSTTTTPLPAPETTTEETKVKTEISHTETA